jgi:hypothetical protein
MTTMRQQLSTREKWNTIQQYFSLRKSRKPVNIANDKDLFNPPFSVAYYSRSGVRRVKGAIKRRHINKASPWHKSVQVTTLFTCGFLKNTSSLKRLSKDQVAEEADRTEFSGTFLSMAP